MRAIAVLLIVDTAIAPSAELLAGAKNSVGIFDVTVELAAKVTLFAVISLVPPTSTIAEEFVTTTPTGSATVDKSPFAVAVAFAIKVSVATISPLLIITAALAVGTATKSAKLSTVKVAFSVMLLPYRMGAAPAPSPTIISASPPPVRTAVKVTSPVVPAVTIDPFASVIFGASSVILPAAPPPLVESKIPPDAIVIDSSA